MYCTTVIIKYQLVACNSFPTCCSFRPHSYHHHPLLCTSALAGATSLASGAHLRDWLLNELDREAKAWWYGWTCKSIFHIISPWAGGTGLQGEEERPIQSVIWTAREVKPGINGRVLLLSECRICTVEEMGCHVSYITIYFCFSPDFVEGHPFNHSILWQQRQRRICGETSGRSLITCEMTYVLCLSAQTCHDCSRS